MEFIKNIFRDKKNGILAAVITLVTLGFAAFDYYENESYSNEGIGKRYK